jgi:hypothetical protein
VSINDAFTGVNGTGIVAYSSNWAYNVGATTDFQIQSNGLTIRNAASLEIGARRTESGFPNDQFAQVTFAAMAGPASQVMGVSVRGAGTRYYGFYADNNVTTAAQLFKYDGTTWTQLGSSGATFTTADTIKLQVAGTTLTPIKNGATLSPPGAQTDATYANGAPGVSAFNNSEANNLVRIDDFLSTDTGGATPQPTPRMISRQRVGFNAIPRASNLYQPAAPVDNTPQPTGGTDISPLAQARPKAIIRGRFVKAPVLEHVRPAVATAAPQAFVAQLTAATFTFTPQDTTRLNAYVAALSSAVFQFTANALTRLTTVVSSLSSAVFTFTPQALTRLTTVVNVLSSAVFTFTPQTLRQMVSYVASLSAAAFQFTAQALTRVNAYAAQLSAATFQFVGRAVSYTVTGGAVIVSDWLQRARRRRR